MSKSKYTEESIALGKAVDVAIDSIKKFPPKNFSNDNLSQFVNNYLRFKNSALNPEPKYHNLESLSYIKADILTYFQEGTGDAVHYFWKQLKEQRLGFKRENKLIKILKREKIKNQVEYDFIIDVLIPYEQEGLVSDEDVRKFHQMISIFEGK